MFETIDAVEMKMPVGILGEGQRIWKYVNFRLHVQWFYMLYETEFEKGSFSSDFVLLTDERQIAEISSFEYVKIIDVYIVSPGHLNGSDCWKMEKLKEIWTAKIKKFESDEEGMIYVLQDNSEYIYSPSIMDSEAFMKDELLVKTE